MDICTDINSPHSQNVTSFEESYLKDINSDTSEPPTVQGQDSREESRQSHVTDLISKKILSKSSTFPSPNKISVSNREVDAKESVNKAVDVNPKSATQPCQRSISMPTPSKIRSALKGGREKEGIQIIDNLTVKWAPDVYDPIPTAVSHVVTPNKNQSRTNSKKNKNKHKRRARGKDKKQQQPQQPSKYVSVGSTSAKSLDDDMALVESEGGPQTDLDFNDVGRDPHCGSSFLKESVAEKMHFSVAEAT
jgi:hypothetical protein